MGSQICPNGWIARERAKSFTDFQNKRTSFFGPEGGFLASYQWTKNISIPLAGSPIFPEKPATKSASQGPLVGEHFKNPSCQRSWSDFVG
jgi:hypothetical protein